MHKDSSYLQFNSTITRGQWRKLETVENYCTICERQQKHLKGKVYICELGHETDLGYTKKEKKRIDEMRENCKIRNHIHIQIGDDDGKHKDHYYQIHGVHGDFTLTMFRRFKVHNSIDDKEEIKTEKIKRYHANIQQVMKAILAYELKDKQAATLPELLEVLKSIDSRLESLGETLFEISINKEQD